MRRGFLLTCTAAAAVPVLALSSGAALANAAPGTNAATSAAAMNYCQTPVDLTQPAPGQATINRFDIGKHESTQPRFDRVVIGLTGPAANYQVRYVPQVIADGSGLPVPLKGNADLEVRVDGAVAHDQNGHSTVPVANYEPTWGSLRQAKLVSDFEGVVIFGLGLRNQVDFQVSTLTGPDRLVIDVAMPGEHPWNNCQSGAVRVFFFNESRFFANTEPFYTPVWRRVQVPAVAGGALNSLFHGPLATEYQQGLRFLNSEAGGFTGLSISNGTARVRLTGGCDAHGSTESIAGEIIPILKQFPNVTYVKIFDPNGQTADPAGPHDSIPDCLNP